MGNPREIHYVPIPGTSSPQAETSLTRKRKEKTNCISSEEDTRTSVNCCSSEVVNRNSAKKMRLLENYPTLAQTIMENVWGPHNTTMTLKEREKYLSQPPIWAPALRNIITYEKPPKKPDMKSPEEEKLQ